ncbi:type II secretion system protein M [Aliamphritea ceti]|uniref:type II secretion system protein M n=1 Tax=Aliamphritea ceti TaxID=1524258 RepID=UPI0021C25F56|nr:type II secretion system protein M [Aliamphritea ceti]
MTKDYLSRLSPKELKTLAIAIPTILLLFSWLLLIKPVLESNQQLQQQLKRKQADLAWMQKARYQISPPLKQSQPSTEINLRQQINDVFSRKNISSSRLNSSGTEQLSMTVDSAEFNHLIDAITTLENKSILLTQGHITPLQSTGIVTAKLTFSYGTEK